ncbi:YitT family protein [Desulforhabdus amnigena]|uniref:Membrane protein n=1 Tax=Desulforhabdus amnigena TaxID=40218 RepID=A0A9W6D0X0_9BACT|nr:YitT family protein [Desulforhabdus amnigena]GLI34027.1 membrane protein [Desulforhabdus amnigena]
MSLTPSVKDPITLQRSSISWPSLFWNLFLITTGSCVFSVGLNSVLIPQQFLSGGVVGIALIFHYFLPKFNTGLFYFLLNIPLILLGWFSVSRTFMLYTAYGMAVFSLSAAWVNPYLPPVEDPILGAILAGVICGTGAGIILRSQGSAGGLDILGVYLNKKLGLRVGMTVFALSSSVLVVGGYFFDFQKALYSLIYVYASGRIMDAVITGFNQRKSVLIVSNHSDAIAKEILTRLNRGVTFLHGTGGYTRKRKQVIFSIITLTELAKVKELVYGIDPHAFMVVNDTLEVLGQRHGTRRVF